MRIHASRLATAGALTATLTCIATAATAVPPPDATSQVLAVTGSPITEDAMGALSAGYNANGVYNPDHDSVFNVPSRPDPPYVVPSQGACPQRTYAQDGTPHAPASSGSSRTRWTRWSWRTSAAAHPTH